MSPPSAWCDAHRRYDYCLRVAPEAHEPTEAERADLGRPVEAQDWRTPLSGRPQETSAAPPPDGLKRLIAELGDNASWRNWREALEAVHQRFLALGGGYASLNARVGDIEQRLSSAEANIRGHEDLLGEVSVNGLNQFVNGLCRRVEKIEGHAALWIQPLPFTAPQAKDDLQAGLRRLTSRVLADSAADDREIRVHLDAILWVCENDFGATTVRYHVDQLRRLFPKAGD